MKELIQLHGGTVQASSGGKDQGTTVTMEFPVPAVLDQPGTWLRRRAGVEPPGARLDGVSIVFADDEPEVLAAIAGLLRHHGAEVVTATSADEALRLLNQHQPTVFVSDLAMPGRDGFDLLRAVRALPSQARDGAEALASARARPPVAILMDIFIMDGLTATRQLSRDAALKHIPVIAQTAQPASLDKDRGLFFAILQKPSNPQELLKALSRALVASRPMQPEARC